MLAPAMPSYAVMFVTKWATTLVLWAPYTLVLVVSRPLTECCLHSSLPQLSLTHWHCCFLLQTAPTGRAICASKKATPHSPAPTASNQAMCLPPRSAAALSKHL